MVKRPSGAESEEETWKALVVILHRTPNVDSMHMALWT